MAIGGGRGANEASKYIKPSVMKPPARTTTTTTTTPFGKSPTVTKPPPLSQLPRSTSMSIADAPRRLSIPVGIDLSGRRHSAAATAVLGTMAIQTSRNVIGAVTPTADGRRLSREELPFFQQVHDPRSWTQWLVQQAPGHRMLMRASPASYAEATEGKTEKTAPQKVPTEFVAAAQPPVQQEKGGKENASRSQRRSILAAAAAASVIPTPKLMPTTGRRESSDEKESDDESSDEGALPPPLLPPPPPATELRRYTPRKSYYSHHRSGGQHASSGGGGGGGIIAALLSPILKALKKRDGEEVLRGRNGMKSVAESAGRRGAQQQQNQQLQQLQPNGPDQQPEIETCLRQLDRFLHTQMLRHTQSEMAVLLSSSPQFYPAPVTFYTNEFFETAATANTTPTTAYFYGPNGFIGGEIAAQ